MLFQSIEADFHEAIAKQGLEMWQVSPKSWCERFALTWRVFAYPSRHIVMVLCKRGTIEELANAQR